MLHCAAWSVAQEPSGSRTTSESGRADLQAAEAEADMSGAGDVGEWLGMDSSRKAVTVNGHAQASLRQQHRLSRQSSSDRLSKVSCSLHAVLVLVHNSKTYQEQHAQQCVLPLH